MNIVSKEHLVKGRKNNKTQEKIRIKLRFLLNKHQKASIFHSNYPDAKLAFHLENKGYKQAFVVYQSSNLENCFHYNMIFNDLYSNEVNHQNESEFNDPEGDKSLTYRLIIAMRKLKKGY